MSKNGKKKKFSLKDFNKLKKQKDKAKYQLAEMKKKNPHLQQSSKDPKLDAMIKLNAMNSLIGFLVRKGHDSGLPMEILIDITNDYEKKIEDMKND